MLETLSQLTVGTAAVFILGYDIKLFMKRLQERDVFLEKLIDNHFHSSQERDIKIASILDKIYEKIK